jgi:hypothetical protein
MSHTIIFEAKFIKLSDGRLLHLDRSGCNNDDAGRDLSDYSGKIYTENELKERINYYLNINNDGDGWDLKIGSKCVTYKEYGEHLLRMAKRAITYDEFIAERSFSAKRYDGVNLLKPEEKFMTPKEFDKSFYDYLYSGKPFSYTSIRTTLNSEEEITKALDSGESVSFYVGKTYNNQPRKPKEQLTEYFVVCRENGNNKYYLSKVTSRRLSYTYYTTQAKQFKTEKEAQKWITDRNIQSRFRIECKIEKVVA